MRATHHGPYAFKGAALIIRAQYPSEVAWTWTRPDPPFWAAFHQINGVGPFVFDDMTTGDSRTYAPDGGQHPMYIVGVDSTGRELTHRSNVVIPDSAPPP